MKPALPVFALLCFASLSVAKTPVPLKGLSRLAIVVEETGAVGNDIHLTRQDLESQALVSLRRVIPALHVLPEAIPYLYVSVVGVKDETGYAFFVHVGVWRPTILLDDEGSARLHYTMAEVWGTGTVHSGNGSLMASKIRESVDIAITSLAADYYKQNPN